MTATASPVISVEGLTKRFRDSTVVDAVSFEVDRGEIFGLVGPDGCGKTTMMRMLAGVMRPDAGSIVLDNVNVRSDAETVKSHLSYMPQRFGLYEDLTVDENIRFYADLFEVPAVLREQRSERLLAAANMGHFRRFRAGQLSGGMKQKLGLTCALVHTPKVLLLDEPTTGVDPLSRRDFWRILYGLREQGVTILISTAYLDEAERCNRLVLLNKGRVLYCDTPDGLKQRMPGALVSIISPNGRAARDVLRTCPGIRHLLRVGDGVHAVVDDADVRIPQILEALTTAGVAFSSMRVVPPSIEDLFVALLDEGPPA